MTIAVFLAPWFHMNKLFFFFLVLVKHIFLLVVQGRFFFFAHIFFFFNLVLSSCVAWSSWFYFILRGCFLFVLFYLCICAKESLLLERKGQHFQSVFFFVLFCFCFVCFSNVSGPLMGTRDNWIFSVQIILTFSFHQAVYYYMSATVLSALYSLLGYYIFTITLWGRYSYYFHFKMGKLSIDNWIGCCWSRWS